MPHTRPNRGGDLFPSAKRLSDRFAEAASSCASLAKLGVLLERACRELGFDYFALLHHGSLADGGRGLVRLDNYPRPWVEEIADRHLAPHDPVHFASRHSSAPFRWDAIERLVELDPRQRAVFERSRTFGIGDGFTIPANIIGEPAGSCSFAQIPGGALVPHRLDCASLVGAHAFQAARRLLALRPPIRRAHLSPRQIECLGLIADGKTDWEIARILGLRPETVRDYVGDLRRIYKVGSRTQLIRPGLDDAWLDF